MFPVVPIPGSLLEALPWLVSWHSYGAYIGAGLFGCFGFLMLLDWVPYYGCLVQAPQRIQEGVLLILLGVAFLLFGAYVGALLVVGVIGWILSVLVRGFAIAIRCWLNQLKFGI